MNGDGTPSALWGAAAACCLLLILSTGAQAYIDAGTGSYVLQVAIAALLAAGFVIKCTWRNIKGAIAKRISKRRAGD